MDNAAIYVEALQALDVMDANLRTDFEIAFLEDHLRRVETYGLRTRFSAKQQAVIRRMVEAYLGPEQAAEWFHGQQRLPGH